MGAYEGFGDWIHTGSEGGESGGQPNKHELVSVLARCVERRLVVTPGHLISIGKRAAKKWKAATKLNPYKTPEIVGKNIGTMVNGYPRTMLHCVDHAIDEVLNDADEPEPIFMAKVDDVGSSILLVEQEFGIKLRGHQTQALQALLEGRNVILHVPTGGGKSVVFQGASRLLIDTGVTVVVYPLKALVADQSTSAEKWGVNCVPYYGDIDQDDRPAILDRIENDQSVSMVLTVPEMLAASKKLRDALVKRGVSLVAVDEAHVYDEWALSFRNSYQMLGKSLKEIGDPQILLCSATLTSRGAVNAARALNTVDWKIVQTRAVRPNLSFADAPTDTDQFLMDALDPKGCEHAKPAGICFFTWKSSVQATAEWMTRFGRPPLTYHAGLKDKQRQEAQADWTNNDKWVFATKAFGMGIDKPNVRTIFHAQLPTSILDYAQEAGRAGRDGHPSVCYLPRYDYMGYKSRPLGSAAQFLIDLSYPTLAQVKTVWNYLDLKYRGSPVWHHIKPKAVSRSLFRTDAKNDIVRKCIAWLAMAGMLEKRARPDQYTFDVNHPAPSGLTGVNHSLYGVMNAVKHHGRRYGNHYVLTTAEMSDFIAPLVQLKGKAVKGWKNTLKRWYEKGYVKGKRPGPNETHVRISPGAKWEDFAEHTKLLKQARQTAQDNLEMMRRVARARPENRAALIEQAISLNVDEFVAGLRTIVV